MQLSMAVGDVRITRPAVDYDRYLCREADSHSEGLCCFLTIAVVVYWCMALHIQGGPKKWVHRLVTIFL